jgi:hypothetical protein
MKNSTNTTRTLSLLEYDRDKALQYANQWSLIRNPSFYNFDKLGGDCTNFASQVLFSGCNVMNFTPITGWYYKSLNNRAPAWSGAEYFCKFLVTNKLQGPYGKIVSKDEIQTGDFVQLSFSKTGHYNHTLIIVKTTAPPIELENILVSAHTIDVSHKHLSLYLWERIRFIHILGARK